MTKRASALAALILLFSLTAIAEEKVKEPSTGKSFPAQVSFTQDGKDYTLTLTGVAVRKKFIFKVYGMAHYTEEFTQGTEKEAFAAALDDGKAKEIIMDFARDVDAGKIRDAYAEGFQEHAKGEEFKEIKPTVDEFLGFFTQDVKENDQFVLRWTPGGTITSIIIGQEKPAITNPTFARILWSIWFGEDSVVDREDLVKRMVKD
jgi:hypothetical protein